MNAESRGWPGFDKLFKMQSSCVGARCFYADLEDDIPDFELLRGEWRPAAPLVARWAYGRSKPGAIAQGCTVGWFYLSPQVQQLFRQHKLTGWKTYPIELYDKYDVHYPGYSGFSITGRCGLIRQELSTTVPEEVRKPGDPDLQGMYFDESTWDGSDFFCPAGVNAFKFASQRAKQVFDAHRIRGFEFTPLTEAMWYP